MPDYVRNRVPGGTFFFTVTLRERRSDLLTAEVGLLRDAVRWVRTRAPFQVDAWVVLPEHMHCVWTLPDGDTDYPERWRAIKKRFSKSLPPTEYRSAVMRDRNERGIWQRRYWEHTVRDAADYAAHVDYVHFNPVKHGLVGAAADWPYSSFHASVRRGVYPANWAGRDKDVGETGERATSGL